MSTLSQKMLPFVGFLLLFSLLTLFSTSCSKDATTTTYSVTFHTNGGTDVESITTNAGTTITQPTNPTQAGYTFAGWYKDQALTQAFDFSTPITESITLYAKWTAVQTTTSDESIFTYSINNNEITITGLTIEAKAKIINNLTIPSTINNLPVVAIGDTAFARIISNVNNTIEFDNNTNLTGTLTLPSSIKTIGWGAFTICSGFTGSLNIPSSVKSIGDIAFGSCSGLGEVTMVSSSPPNIGTGVFDNTSSSLTIKVPSGSLDAYKTANNWSAYASKIDAQ